MTMRTRNRTITFHRPFCLKGVDRLLPPADYRVVTDEELIEGLSFPAYHRVSTVIFVPGLSRSSVEMVTIDPSRRNGMQQCPTRFWKMVWLNSSHDRAPLPAAVTACYVARSPPAAAPATIETVVPWGPPDFCTVASS